MEWTKPYTFEELLRSSIIMDFPKIPEVNSVYVVSAKKWRKAPSIESQVLYVGSNTGASKRFRTRVGDLIADLFGFYCESTGHHSGGQSLNKYCIEHQIDPMKLYFSWMMDCNCMRCMEGDAIARFQPLLNKKKASRCKVHSPIHA